VTCVVVLDVSWSLAADLKELSNSRGDVFNVHTHAGAL
jgi:hypothetical protein